MDITELEKSKAHITVEIIEYFPNSVLNKKILKKSSGNISIMSFDTGEGLIEKTSPFDIYAQIIEGKAELVIDGTSIILETGQSIIIPAHKSNHIKANGHFKLMQTAFRSAFE